MQGKQRQEEDLGQVQHPGFDDVPWWCWVSPGRALPSWRVLCVCALGRAWAEGNRRTGSGLAGGSVAVCHACRGRCRPTPCTRARTLQFLVGCAGQGRQERPTERRRGRSDRVGEKFGTSSFGQAHALGAFQGRQARPSRTRRRRGNGGRQERPGWPGVQGRQGRRGDLFLVDGSCIGWGGAGASTG